MWSCCRNNIVGDMGGTPYKIKNIYLQSFLLNYNLHGGNSLEPYFEK